MKWQDSMRFLAFIAVVAALSAHLSSAAPAGPTRTVQSFFKAIQDGNYQKAYAYLSSALKDEISFSDFKTRASDIHAVKLLGLKTLDRENNLVKYRVTAKVRLLYENRLCEAVYKGQVDMVSEKSGWRVYSVELKAAGGKALPELTKDREIRFKREKQGR